VSVSPRPAPGRTWIGISGYDYPNWRAAFYPPDLPRRRWLAHASRIFDSIELNGTFYSLKSPDVFRRWAAETPDRGFVFAIKGSRFITHMLKLRRFERPLANFWSSGLLRLGATLGPILWQLPPQLPFDGERARRFFGAVPRDVAAAERLARRHDARTTGRAALRAPDGRNARIRHAVEVRHPSWLADRALETLRALDVALVAADTAGKYPLCLERTGRFAYVRLHGSSTLYASRYRDAELAVWAQRITAWSGAGDDVYVYFDNDARGHAPHDALRLETLERGNRRAAEPSETERAASL
jgi:uncharacterized protein YecE (DUF72 family)